MTTGKVSINRLLGEPAEAIDSGIERIGGLRIPRGSNLIIKPNICNSRNPYGMVLTDFRVIRHTIKIAQKSTDDITVVESDNVSGNAKKRAEESGLTKMLNECGVEFRNLSEDAHEEHQVQGVRIRIPKSVLEADYFINLPKMKTEGHAMVTLSIKNLFGVLVEKDKRKFHRSLDQILPYLCKTIRNDLIVVDGIVCMEGNGPVIGTPKCLNLVVVGTNPVEVDSVCARIMGFNPSEVNHIALASQIGAGEIDLNKIELVGENIDDVCTIMERPYSIRATLKSVKSVPKFYV